MDYSNSILFGTSVSNLRKVQRVQNTLAKIVLNNSSLSSTTALRQLHRLPVKQRIHFKIATLTYRTLQSGSPSYLSSLINLNAETLLQDFSALLHTIYYMFLSPPRPLVVKPSVLQLQQFWIPSHSVSGNDHLLAPSNVISNSFIYPLRLVHFPTQRHQRLRLEHASICALYKFCNNNNNDNNKCYRRSLCRL